MCVCVCVCVCVYNSVGCHYLTWWVCVRPNVVCFREYSISVIELLYYDNINNNNNNNNNNNDNKWICISIC